MQSKQKPTRWDIFVSAVLTVLMGGFTLLIVAVFLALAILSGLAGGG